jgi:hypothetical protein
MEYSVKLATLPAEVKFPERLSGRIGFEAERGQLVYRGFMTKCTYDELSALSSDLDYHRALEQLFVLTSEEVAPHVAARRLPAAILLATIGAAAFAVAVLWMISRHAAADKPAASDAGVAVSSAPR